ncbi:DUF6169 family protein [Sphingobacterium psychroaquaticum]|uniref:Uncharacterized protein n=1 Tax=Sphingobacterium psychroaquaticum TaxID=561061 RepID=A0A1X7KSY7_9SPHI|nr:hypothetical protein SAMN05660862_3145 [Sphingobacterium psychroaquaticum]
MFARYKVYRHKDGKSYFFRTRSGNTYFAYFTAFVLQDKYGSEINLLSFGFSCHLADKRKPQHYDQRIKNTIISIIEEYFTQEPRSALLFFCTNLDGKAHHRFYTFDRWFKESSFKLEKFDTPKKSAEKDFYGSLLVKPDNPEKQKIMDAFYFTIDFWKLS